MNISNGQDLELSLRRPVGSDHGRGDFAALLRTLKMRVAGLPNALSPMSADDRSSMPTRHYKTADQYCSHPEFWNEVSSVVFRLLGTFVAARDWLQSFTFHRST
jgi:hypothetical protein